MASITVSRSIALCALILGTLLLTACQWWEKPGGEIESVRVGTPEASATPATPSAGQPPSGSATPQVKFSQREPPAGDTVEVWRVDNLLRVFNGGTPTAFTLAKDYWVTEVGTYHYNDGKGKPAGTLAVKASDGTTYGPWQAELDQGWYWRAKPNTWIPAGSYTVIDSDPSTWSQNDATSGQGIAWMFGKPAP